jgi:hypothetical protein
MRLSISEFVVNYYEKHFQSCIEAREFFLMLGDFPLGILGQDRVDGLVGGEHFIEVGHVEDVFAQLRLKFGHILLRQHLLDIQVREPRVLDDVLQTILGTQSLVRVLCQAFVYEVLAVFRHCDAVLLGVGEENWLSLYQLIHLLVVRLPSVEWREAHNHFIRQNSQRPPVHREGMTNFFKNFGSKILRRTTKRMRLLILLKNFSQPKICQANKSIFAH